MRRMAVAEPTHNKPVKQTCDGRCLDVGQLDSFNSAHMFFLKKIHMKEK